MRVKSLLRGVVMVGVMLGAGAGAFGAIKLPSVKREMDYGGLRRTYLVYRPAGLAMGSAVPLVVMLHGRDDTGAFAEKNYHWDREADANGFVVVYPNGYDNGWNAGGCCRKAEKRNVDDVGFLNAMIEKVTADEHIDPARVYVTGMSNGALMAYRMACDAPVKMAAIGAVSGTLVEVCATPRPVSVMEIHGMKDLLLPFAGKASVGEKRYIPGVEFTLDHWRKVDQCSEPVVTAANGVMTAVAKCAEGRSVALITIDDAGHQWPGGKKHLRVWDAVFHGLAEPSKKLDATSKLWEFFAAHPEPTQITGASN
jgi:polyhydroxybutyrate depolymerase